MKLPDVPWKLFFLLLIFSITGFFSVLPYSFALQAPLMQKLPVSLPLLIFLQMIQNAVLFAIVIFFGLLLAPKTGLGFKFLTHYLAQHRISEKIQPILMTSVIAGIIAGMIIMALDIYLFKPWIYSSMGESADKLYAQGVRPEAWKGFLASFYGGFNEEILLRFFLLSLFAWIGQKIAGKENTTTAIFWSANILAAVIFGLGHLPATSALVELTVPVVARAVALNGAGGIIFGWLYWKKGLESAMLAHFSADIVLHVIFAV